jgi:1,4-dihydroxy-2-naphthoyl-CoA hydrolase
VSDTTSPQATDRTAQVHAGMPFSAYLGVESVTGDADEIRARLAWDEGRCTDAGTLHGGALMGLADVLGGIVAFLNLPADAVGTTTIESKTNFFRAVREGHVEAVSKPLHRGRTTIVVDTELFDPDGRLVGRVTQTQAVLYPRV